jgi:large subunit ribosomal protein L15
MELSSLSYARGSRKDRKRVGRGGARGKTSGRGHKGAKSRSGAKNRLWFEGGQMSIQRRLPKRGFHNFNKQQFQIINVGDLAKLGNVKEVTQEVLLEKGLVKKKNIPVKVLGDGDFKAKMTVSAKAFTRSAIEKIEAAGGRAIKT